MWAGSIEFFWDSRGLDMTYEVVTDSSYYLGTDTGWRAAGKATGRTHPRDPRQYQPGALSLSIFLLSPPHPPPPR